MKSIEPANIFYLSKKIKLGVSCESSALRIHMKYQVLFSLKIVKKYLQMSSATVVIGALRVNGSFSPGAQR